MKKIKEFKIKDNLNWIFTRWYFWLLIFIQFIWSSVKNSDELGRIYVNKIIPILIGSFINWFTIFVLIMGIKYLYKKFKNRKKKI